jgi:putative membrane protein
MQPECSSDELREHQSNERTYLSWVRTGIALMGFGFVVARFGVFLAHMHAAGVEVDRKGVTSSSILGIGLVGLALLVFVVATLRYRAVERSIADRVRGRPKKTLPYAVGAVAATIAAGMIALLAAALAT